jgi:hypothetical protein
MFFSQTVHRHEKSIAVPWWSPCLVAVARQLFYGEIANGSSQELHIRLRICMAQLRFGSVGNMSRDTHLCIHKSYSVPSPATSNREP